MGSLGTSGSLPSLEWSQTSPTRFERPIDDLESFFLFIASVGAPYGRQNWAISSGIKFQTDRADIVSDLHRAWTAIRYEHPNVASYVDGSRWVYEVVQNDAELQQWLSETFVVHSSETSARDLFVGFQPTKRMILHVLPHTQEAIIQCPHTHTDGLGTVTLFNNMLQSLAIPSKQPPFGDEAKNLLPPFTITAKVPKLTAEHQARWNANMGTWLQNMPTIGLAASATDRAPGPSRVQSLTFSNEETRAIISTAKKMGATPTHVGHAAAALATRVHGGKLELSTHATLGIFAERDLCELPSDVIVTPHVTALPMVVDLGDFESTVRSAKEAYTGNKAEKYSLSVSPLFADQIVRVLSEPQPEVSSGATISSLGLLDPRFKTEYGDIKLDDYWFTINMVTPDVVVYIWTFQGRLTFEISYNEMYHPEESIGKYLQLIKDQLAQGLKVELN